MIYEVIISPEALVHIKQIIKSGEQVSIKRLKEILDELETHPESGIGNPKQLKHNYAGSWSRKVSAKHRLVYTIDQQSLSVFVLSAKGHYLDK